ncbi:hypothetical protein OBBRIDRAFT_751320 [Obba rivulosa]|uniref:BTB domain-containing protein n=1 Tax=Obba rivulosa TaxID=1052685 RepID=A0A8E2B4R9_9APHY|nr:hypothetical protein OBBRIDRAFT_751320 [Obba rivulosa]
MASSATFRDGLTPSQQLLKRTLYSQCPTDIKFWVFSRRTVSQDDVIRVDRPLHVFASSAIVKEVSTLNRLLEGGFKESCSRVKLDSDFPERAKPYTEEYDYDSDSDLEDDFGDEDEPPAINNDYITPASLNGQGREIAPEIDTYGSSWRQSSADGIDGSFALPPRGARNEAGSGNIAHLGAVQGSQNYCYQVIIKDASVHTWRALLFYLYTGEVKCLPLSSQPGDARDEAFKLSLSTPNCAPPCSAKSLYRLADKYDLPYLKMKALVALKDKLTTQNIITEVFSRFTSRYDEVRQMECTFLRKHYDSHDVQVALKGVFDKMSSGQLPYASDILKLILDAKFSAAQSPLPKVAPVYSPYGDGGVPLLSPEYYL